MRKRLRDLYSFPKPTINHQSMASLSRKPNLKKYKHIIENLSGDGIQFFSDHLNHKALFYFSEQSDSIYSIGHGILHHDKIDVYRKLQLPKELEKEIISKCVEFS